MPNRKRSRLDKRPVPEGQSSDNGSETGDSESSKVPNLFLASRLDEKEELQWLNDRLANYIDFIQQNIFVPGSANGFDIQADYVKGKLKDLGSVYTAELTALRKRLDEAALKLTETELKLKTSSSSRDEALKELNEIKAREARAASENISLSARITSLEKEINHYQRLSVEHDKVAGQQKLLQSQLEQETLLRTDLQNRVLSLTEDVEFKEKLLSSEREAFAKEALQIHVNATAVEAEKYRHKLKVKLDELRKEMANQLKELILKFENNAAITLKSEKQRADDAEDRAQALNDQCDRTASLLRMRTTELTQCRSELEVLNRRLDDLNAALSASETKHHELTDRHRVEINRLLDLLDEKSLEAAELAGIKVQLDAEIAMYRSLLESEESRCHLSVTSRPELITKPVVVRRSARKRVASHNEPTVDLDAQVVLSKDLFASNSALTEQLFTQPTGSDSSIRITCSSDGPIYFANADPSDGLLKIFNASDEPINMSNWRLFFGPSKPGANDRLTLHVFDEGHIVQPHSDFPIHLCSTSGDQVDRISAKKRRPSSPTLYLVTEAPVWKPYSSTITLEDADGLTRSVCEIKPAGLFAPSTLGVINCLSKRDHQVNSFRITCTADGQINFEVMDSSCALLCIRNAGDESCDLTGWQIVFQTKNHETRQSLSSFGSLQPKMELPLCLSSLHNKRTTVNEYPMVYMEIDAPVEEHYNSKFTLYDAEGQVRATSLWEEATDSELGSDLPEFDEPPTLMREPRIIKRTGTHCGGPVEPIIVDRYRHFLFMNRPRRNGICSCPMM